MIINNIPDDRIYSQQHIWLQIETYTIAKNEITDFVQLKLGNIVFVELSEVNNEYQLGQACVVEKSV